LDWITVKNVAGIVNPENRTGAAVVGELEEFVSVAAGLRLWEQG
jgi:hypothetical protein